MLTANDVLTIYEYKIWWNQQPEPHLSLRGQSQAVSKRFGVSSRTVRDIWNRRSWACETKQLWSREPFSVGGDNNNVGRRAGRPKGSRDKKQRARRLTNQSASNSVSSVSSPSDSSAANHQQATQVHTSSTDYEFVCQQPHA